MTDWTKIEAAYIAGDMSLRELAKRRKLSYSTLSKAAASGGWAEKRKQFRAEVANEALDAARERGRARLETLMSGTEQLLDAAVKALQDELQFQRYVVTEGLGEGVSETEEKTFEKRDTRAMKDMAAVITSLSGLLRDFYGINTPAQELGQQLARERLRLEQKRTEAAVRHEKAATANPKAATEKIRAELRRAEEEQSESGTVTVSFVGTDGAEE